MIIQKAEEIYNKGIREVNLIYSDRVEKKRIGRTAEGSILIMANRSRRRGYYLSSNLTDLKDIQAIEQKPISEKWLKSIDKAIKILSISGLWLNVLEELKTAKNIGYEKLQKARIIDNTTYKEDYNENKKEQLNKLKELDIRFFKINEEGQEVFNYNFWNYTYPLKIKKMYFGKWNNNEKLKQIEQALKDKNKIHISGQNGYDVSFDYDGLNKAWYSEEYKNCGNGHYYLALSNKYALFYEDD